MQFKPIELLFLWIGFQSFLFVFFLLSNKSVKRTSYYLLAAFLGLVGFQMLANAIFAKYDLVLNIKPLGFIHGPLFYLYVISIQELNFTLKKSDLLHAIPFLLVGLLNLFIHDLNTLFYAIGVMMSILSYIIGSLVSISRYDVILRATQSNVEQISLRWIKQFIYLLLAIAVFDSFRNTFFYDDQPIHDVLFMTQMLLLLGLVNFIVFKGLKYPELFRGVSEIDKQVVESNKTKYVSSNLSETDLDQLESKLKMLFETEETYLDPNLSLQLLSDKLNASPRDVSQVINSRFDKNFSDFINSYRVNKAIEQFKADVAGKKTVLEVLYDVGFNSKSSFYTAFKAMTQQTPTEFRKALAQKSVS